MSHTVVAPGILMPLLLHEMHPPVGADPRPLTAAIRTGWTPAVIDNPAAAPAMSGTAAAVHLRKAGVEPWLVLACRDYNRIAMQSLVIGAVALGITRVILRPGRHQRLGAMPAAMSVNDLDHLQLARILLDMRNLGILSNGARVTGMEPLTIGVQISAATAGDDLARAMIDKASMLEPDLLVTTPVSWERFMRWHAMLTASGAQPPVLAGLAAGNVEPDAFTSLPGIAGVYLYHGD